MSGIVYAIVGIIELLLGLRFVFRLLGANPDSGFVSWVYSWSAPLVAPFHSIFGGSTPTPGTVVTGVVEWGTVVAFIIYAVIGAIIGGLFARHGRAHV